MEYSEIREHLLEDLLYLQRNKYSYQSLCDYVNRNQDEFVLFKDFFSRFRSKQDYYKGKSKAQKLATISTHISEFRKNKQKLSGKLESSLILLIEEANKEEFRAYSKVNTGLDYDEKELVPLFGINNPAAKVIQNNLRHKKQYNWVLSTKNHGSDFRILDIRLTNMFSEFATIQTNEYWKLYWIDKETKTLQFVYDAINEQTYLVSKNKDGSWEVKDNIYTANENKRRPRYIDDATLSGLIKNGEKANYETLLQLLDSNELGLALAFFKRLSKHKLSKEEKKRLDLINTSYLQNLRALNTNNKPTNSFLDKNAELKKDINTLWKETLRKA